MNARQHEEIFEECLSAYLEGRRSIEESLSLYPSFAPKLEPLLRAAIGVSEVLNAQSPSLHVQQRGLQRFLSDARARRSLASLKFDEVGRGRLTVLWQKYRLGLAGAGIALFVAGLSIGGSAVLGGGRDSEPAFEARQLPPTPAAVRDFQAALQRVRDRGLDAQRSDLLWLKVATEDLQDISSEEITPLIETLTAQLAEAEVVVSTIAGSDSDFTSEAEETGDTIRAVAGVLTNPTLDGIDPVTTSSANPTPVGSEGPSPTITPSTTEEPTDPAATEGVP